jgi:hypothetical protein
MQAISDPSIYIQQFYALVVFKKEDTEKIVTCCQYVKYKETMDVVIFFPSIYSVAVDVVTSQMAVKGWRNAYLK